VLVKEPGSCYLGHVSPADGTSASTKIEITNYLASIHTNMYFFNAVGCDGANVNTGVHGGIIRLLELELNKPLQWFICLLHANELPLRKLLNTLDGNTSGPNSFTGLIGKLLHTAEKLDIVKFKPIKSNLPSDLLREELSKDQLYLYDISMAISRGAVSLLLASYKPGPVVHSRWLTTANRILRLYVSTKKPSQNLVLIVTFIMKVYGPMWFKIKFHPYCFNGAGHLYEMVHLIRYMGLKEKETVQKVIQNNAYFAHPENLLIAMLSDNKLSIRKFAYNKVIEARRNAPTNTLRQFIPPILNFNANNYTELIDWNQIDVTEPPMIKHIPDKDLKILIIQNSFKQNVQMYPCHTQATERCIKLVTQASQAVCSKRRRDGFIRVTIESRKKMKTFNTKSEFIF
jgi:hypothetical protein